MPMRKCQPSASECSWPVTVKLAKLLRNTERVDPDLTVVMPKLIFSVLSSAVEAGVKKPVMATRVMIDVGMICIVGD